MKLMIRPQSEPDSSIAATAHQSKANRLNGLRSPSNKFISALPSASTLNQKTMGLMTKLKLPRHREDKSTFFSMRCKPSTDSLSGVFTRKDKPKKLTQTLSQLTVVSIPKEYREEERFNWLTNELDSFQYKPSNSAKATKRASVTTAKTTAVTEQPESDCSISDWLFPCWGSNTRLIEKDVKTSSTGVSQDETSYSSGSTSQHDNKEGEVLEAQPEDDVSDVTSTPSEDCTEDSDESCDSSCSSPAPSPRGSPVIGLEDKDALSLSSGESR